MPPTPFGVAEPTFARSGSATRVNSSGLIENVQANVPRFDYHPITRAILGLLIELGRSNLALWSGSIGGEGSPSVWIASSATLSANNLTGPTGATEMTLVTVSANGGGFRQRITGLTAGHTLAFSIFLKAGTIENVRLRANNAGANANAAIARGSPVASVTATDDGSPAAVTGAYIEDYGNDIYRVTLVFTAAGATEDFMVLENGPGTSGTFYAWGAQVESCSTTDEKMSTSYIPTTSVSVARGSDNMEVAIDGSFFDAASLQGAIFGEFLKVKNPGGALSNRIAVVASTAANRIDLVLNMSTQQVDMIGAIAGTGIIGVGVAGTYSFGSAAKGAMAWATDSFALSVEGSAADQDNNGEVPEVDTLYIGRVATSSTSYLNGHVRKISLYDERLSNADLVLLSGGSEISTEPVLSFNFVDEDIEEQTGSLDNARIGYENFARDRGASSVTASTSDTSGPKDAPLRDDTYEYWQPTAMPATWAVDLGSARMVNFVGIAAHEIGSKECTVKIQASADNATWVDVSDEETPEDDSAIMFLLPPSLYRYWRVYLQAAGSPTQQPRVAVIYIGRALTMQRSIYGGHSPITLARSTVVSSQMSEGGQFLGQGIKRRGFMASAGSFRHLTPAWVRSDFEPFIASARQYPYFHAWRPGDYPDEVVYAWTAEDIKPVNMGLKHFMQVAWNMRAHDPE